MKENRGRVGELMPSLTRGCLKISREKVDVVRAKIPTRLHFLYCNTDQNQYRTLRKIKAAVALFDAFKKKKKNILGH